jgi:hypothetical protein
MAGLNDLVTNRETSSTSLPSWYSTAQQSLVNQATGVNAPALADTAAQSAVSAFGAGSPFTAGQNILQSIGSGAANPWLVSTDATGAQTVTPNVATPLGGLFAAQKDYLSQILPDIEAAETAGSIAGGDFGSRMNLSGIARERGKAFSDLAQKQMQAALQAQQYGVSAGAGLSDIGQEVVKSALETGKFQQNAPYAGAVNLANILGGVKTGQDITKSVQLGGLNQIMGLLAGLQGGMGSLTGDYLRDAKGNVLKDPSGNPIKSRGLLEQLNIKGGLTAFTDYINKSKLPPVTHTSPDSGAVFDSESGLTFVTGADGNQYSIDVSGNYYDAGGNLIWSPGGAYSDEPDYGYGYGDEAENPNYYYDFGYGDNNTNQSYTYDPNYDFGYGD